MMCITSITLTITALDVGPPTDTSGHAVSVSAHHSSRSIHSTWCGTTHWHQWPITALDVRPPTDTSGHAVSVSAHHSSCSICVCM